jgi:hypothetical protein
MLLTAWYYMTHSGVVPETCFPYASQDGNAPSCPSNCDASYKNGTAAFKSQKYFLKTFYSVGTVFVYWERAEKIAEGNLFHTCSLIFV